MPRKPKVQTKVASDDQILESVNQGLDAKQICDKAGLTKGTLRRKLYELSIKEGKLLQVPGLFGSATKTEFEIRKSGSLIIPGKVLEGQGYKPGQRFKIEFDEKRIVLSLV
jgi:hypothetical protein